MTGERAAAAAAGEAHSPTSSLGSPVAQGTARRRGSTGSASDATASGIGGPVGGAEPAAAHDVRIDPWALAVLNGVPFMRGVLICTAGYLLFPLSNVMHHSLGVGLETLLTCMLATCIVINKSESARMQLEEAFHDLQGAICASRAARPPARQCVRACVCVCLC